MSDAYLAFRTTAWLLRVEHDICTFLLEAGHAVLPYRLRRDCRA